MIYRFGPTSQARLEGVHPRLIATAERALAYGILDLTVVPDGGVRTIERQKQLVASGASQTMRSRHLIQADGFGHALDLAPYPVDWGNIERFLLMGTLMFRAAAEEGVILSWGGHWSKFKDFPHFQLEGFYK